MTSLPDRRTADEVVRTSRTALGDGLRCVVVFTPDEYSVLYLRRDLQTADGTARRLKRFFVDSERPTFEAGPRYSDLSLESGSEPEIGEYEFTIRVFSEGFVVPVVVGDRGVLVTTDALDIDGFEEFAVAVRRLLGSSTDSGDRQSAGTGADENRTTWDRAGDDENRPTVP